MARSSRLSIDVPPVGRPLLGGLVALVVVAVLAVVLWPSGDYRVSLRAIDSGQLVPGNHVVVAGVPVGQVTAVTLDRDRRARIELRIDDHRWRPLPRGTRATITAGSLAGSRNRTVALSAPGPGAPGGTIADGGTLQDDEVVPLVDVDNVLTSLDAPTRRRLSGLLRSADRNLAGTGKDAQDALRRTAPALTATARVLRDVAAEEPAVAQLIDAADGLTGTLAAHEEDKVSLFGGGYASYLEERARARSHAREQFEEYAEKKEDLLERARTQRAWMEKGVRNARRKATDGDKHVKAHRGETSEKQAAKARQTERLIERLEVVEEPRKEWELRMEIAAAPRAGAVVATLRDAMVRRGDFTLGPVTLQIDWADRVAITGANGSGKSTLLAALLGRIPLAEGDRHLGPGVVVGEVDQARGLFLGDEPLVAAFGAAVPFLPDAEVR
ncbi:MlaD family protein, partial [Patulibacter sp. NPDC049589]|uniref:MlaD family protein n=1 Tax=Patulibacter sp. NPDC049589 TaxID=3154731 RepID=UPI00342AF1E3